MKTLNKLFQISYGNNFDLNKMELEKNGINFVSRTSKNNGIAAKVKRKVNTPPYPEYRITVALGGSVLTTCVQQQPFYTGQNVAVLTPLDEQMPLSLRIYYSIAIQYNKFRYSACGREANSTLGLIELPDKTEIPLWVYNAEITDISFYKKPLLIKSSFILNSNKWKPFKLSDLFTKIERGKSTNAGALEQGDDIWYIGAKKRENGLIKKVKYKKELITQGNCIILICNGQGSVGYANYMDKDYIGSMDTCSLHSDFLDKYIGLFIVAILGLERFRYNFGRKWVGNRIYDAEIKLPVLMDKQDIPLLNKDLKYIPDFDFMSNYIKTLNYSSKL